MRHTLALALLLLPVSAAPALAQSSVAQFWGSSTNLHVGASMDEVGDLDNDGYVDMVVGAPHPGSQGAVYFVSGKYLETGNGFATLGATFAPTTGDLFGSCVLSVGDVTGDGEDDVFVGEPGAGSPNDGHVYLVSGATRTILWTVTIVDSTFGTSMARCGDVDGDGYGEVVVGCPSSNATGARFDVLSPRRLFLGTGFVLKSVSGGPIGFGTAVSAGDVDGDGDDEYVIGNPSSSYVYVFEQLGPPVVSKLLATVPGTHFGAALDASRDFDGDGSDDIVVGAPTIETVYLLSGAAITAGTGTQNPLGVDIASWIGVNGTDFGAALTTTPDTNADFRPDIVIGAPLTDRVFPAATDCGAIYFISGDTLTQMGVELGVSSGEQLGSSVSRAWDYDNNLRFEVAAGAPLSNYGATDGGIVRFYSLFPTSPAMYCAGKQNSLGCTPSIHWNTSAPSLSAATPCNITATNMVNNKPGMLLYSLLPANTTFQGGKLCLAGSIKRVGVQSTQGNPPPNDCSGTMTYDMNARIQSGADPALGTYGQEVFCQYWARDPGDAFGSALSNALRFVVNP